MRALRDRLPGQHRDRLADQEASRRTEGTTRPPHRRSDRRQLRTGARRYSPGPAARRSYGQGARRGEVEASRARASPERRPVPAWTRAMPTAASFRPSNGAGVDPQAPRGVPAELRAHHGAGARRPGATITAGEDRGAVAQGRLPRGLSEEPERPVLRPAVRKQGPRRTADEKAKEVGAALAKRARTGGCRSSATRARARIV